MSNSTKAKLLFLYNLEKKVVKKVKPEVTKMSQESFDACVSIVPQILKK